MISQTTDPNASRIPRGNRGGITENTSNNCLKPPGAPRPAAVERRECGSNREEKKETGQRKSDASRGRPVRDDCWHELWPRGEKCARPSECIFFFQIAFTSPAPHRACAPRAAQMPNLGHASTTQRHLIQNIPKILDMQKNLAGKNTKSLHKSSWGAGPDNNFTRVSTSVARAVLSFKTVCNMFFCNLRIQEYTVAQHAHVSRS